MAPGDAARGAYADHECQAIAEGDVEEATEELVAASRVTEHDLGHGAVTQQHQEEGPEQLGEEYFHQPKRKLSGVSVIEKITNFLFWFSYILCCLKIGFGAFTL